MDSMFIDDPVSGDGSPISLSVLTLLDTLSNSTEEQCFSARSRSTVLQGLPFGGVPTVLALNFILWLVSGAGPKQYVIAVHLLQCSMCTWDQSTGQQ